MIKLVLIPKKIKTPGFSVPFFKRALRYYILNYCDINKKKIEAVDDYLKTYLNCNRTTRQILLYAIDNLYYSNRVLSLKKDLKIDNLRLDDLVRLLEHGNLDIVGLHVLKKGTDYANSTI